METQQAPSASGKVVITVETSVNAPLEKVWTYWNQPEHIVKWASASEDWHTTNAVNDLRTGGTFTSRMEAKDGSMGFDFGGVYDDVKEKQYIEYTMGDGRKVTVSFMVQDDEIKISESFDAEHSNPVEMQRTGWQNIMDNFKKYVEAN
ncbi:MAG TPA: SRPBCC family protein [Ferruginibacter sp.]|nr:SRPBCC family protein [Ferruginibacter sp.]